MLKVLKNKSLRFCATLLVLGPLSVNAALAAKDIEKPITASEASISKNRGVTEKLVRKLESIRTLSAQFSQEVLGSDGRRKIEEGSMEMKRPGQFRWITTSPFEQEIVAVNDKIWMVDRDLRQVIIQMQDPRQANTPAQLLSGDAKTYLKGYQVGLYEEGRQQKFTLMPVSESDLFEKLDIVFRDDQLNTIELRDSLGGLRRVNFSQVHVNGKISDSDFKVEIPKGYDVMDQTGQ